MTGVDLVGLPRCTACGAAYGEHCRTKETGTNLPPCRSRLLAEIYRLHQQRDSLQRANTAGVMRHREMTRAARYVLKHVEGYHGILDHLRHALAYKHSGMLESENGTTELPATANKGDS